MDQGFFLGFSDDFAIQLMSNQLLKFVVNLDTLAQDRQSMFESEED